MGKNKKRWALCTFCEDPAVFLAPKLGGTQPARCCRECASLVLGDRWEELAIRWLIYRPEDWVDDVAAFLEASATGAPMRR